jgi:hypothetical protein
VRKNVLREQFAETAAEVFSKEMNAL